MSASLTLAATPGGASAAKAGPARTGAAGTGTAEAFGGTLSTVLAAVPANSGPSTAAPAAETTAGNQIPAGTGTDTGTGTAAPDAHLVPAAPPAAAALPVPDGDVQPGPALQARQPRTAEGKAGGQEIGDPKAVLPAGIPAGILGTTATATATATAPAPAPSPASATPPAAPAPASGMKETGPATATPASVSGTAQGTVGSAHVVSAHRAAAAGPAGDTAYLPATASAASAAAAPAVVPAPAPIPSAAPTTSAPAVPVPPGFAAQLARPVFTLASGGIGEHTMTVAVNPESLGPVTVQAHISAAGVRVELFAASADGREALRQILPELKRDLAGAGLNASLDLSAGNQPGSGQDARDQFSHRAATAYPGGGSRQIPMNNQASGAAGLYGTDGSLDVMA